MVICISETVFYMYIYNNLSVNLAMGVAYMDRLTGEGRVAGAVAGVGERRGGGMARCLRRG